MTDTKGLSHTRARLVDSLVLEIARLMADGTWVTGRSHVELAEREKVTVHAVKDWAADAGRLLRLLADDDAQAARAANRATLAAIVADARRDGDHGAAVRGVEAQNKLLGLNAPEKREHTVNAPPVEQTYAALDTQGRIAWLEEKQRELAAMLAEERAKLTAIVTDST
jgi:hypothetical protein